MKHVIGKAQQTNQVSWRTTVKKYVRAPEPLGKQAPLLNITECYNYYVTLSRGKGEKIFFLVRSQIPIYM